MTMDPRLRKAILDAVRGKDSPWPVDKHYPLSGTFQERFKGGDDQILLWAIALAAEDAERPRVRRVRPLRYVLRQAKPYWP